MKHDIFEQPAERAVEPLSFEVLDKALHSITDGICIYDKDATIIYVNEPIFRLCGISKEDALGKTYDELNRMGHFYGDAVINALRLKKVVSSEFVNSINKHLLCTSTPIFDEQGDVHYIVTTVRDITEIFNLQNDLADKKRQLSIVRTKLDKIQSLQKDSFVCSNEKMRKLVAMIDRLAPTDVPILLLGDSGVGKSELAERIHKKSLRSSRQIIVVNCGAIPSSLCEAEFFGYEKGAFTGADRTKAGIFESADGGTLVLDEIGELPISMQVKLLRVLQEGKVKRLGSQKEFMVDFRLIAATNQNLKEMVEKKHFRSDLYHRINVIQFYIPPLRERPEDVKEMLSYFLAKYNAKYGVAKTMSSKLVHTLEHYSWPGNTREMEHVIERLVLLCTSEELTCSYLPEGMESRREDMDNVLLRPLAEAVSDTEKKMLLLARKKVGATRNMAKVLKVSHVTIARKMKQYGLE